MATDICKQALVMAYPDTVEKDWKRTSKKIREGMVYRMFTSPKFAYPVLVMCSQDEEDEMEADEYVILLAGDKLYYMVDETDGDVWLMMTPEGYYKTNDGAMYDQHCGHMLAAIWNIPGWLLADEACENSFVVEGSLEDVIATLDAMGHERVPTTGGC